MAVFFDTDFNMFRAMCQNLPPSALEQSVGKNTHGLHPKSGMGLRL